MRGQARDRKKISSRRLTCTHCGMSGGTLVKVDGGYECQDKEKCRMLQLRR